MSDNINIKLRMQDTKFQKSKKDRGLWRSCVFDQHCFIFLTLNFHFTQCCYFRQKDPRIEPTTLPSYGDWLHLQVKIQKAKWLMTLVSQGRSGCDKKELEDKDVSHILTL